MLSVDNINLPDIQVQYYFDISFNSYITEICNLNQVLLVIDKHVYDYHNELFKDKNVFIIDSGEDSKSWEVAGKLLSKLLDLGYHKSDWLIGIGGGVITDIVGWVSSIYKRGINVGFFPTTILSMVDAAIGGKNGINFGDIKNVVGTIRQPNFIAYDFSFLQTLPRELWVDGFAEIIKHALILDAEMFNIIKGLSVDYYINNISELSKLIIRNSEIKRRIVKEDMNENGNRKLLNFGHTIAHGLEKMYQISHGKAVAIGMAIDAKISSKLLGFNKVSEVYNTLNNYEFVIENQFDVDNLMNYIRQDKKANTKEVDYILLNEIGKASIKKLSFEQIKELIINE